MFSNRKIFLTCFILCLTAVLCEEGRAAQFIPPDGKTLLFIGQSPKAIDAYIAEIGIVPGGLMSYTSIQEVGGLFEPAKDYGAGVDHAQYLTEKYPNTVMQIGLYMVGALDSIIEGVYDENIDTIGRWIKQSEIPVYLRIGYEFDHPENKYDPEKYIEAYKYIVDRLRSQNVDNVSFVWHSYGYVNLGHSTMDWYPGDDYVDWFGVSFFYAYNGNMKFLVNKAREHSKPFMLAEASPFEVGTVDGKKSWNKWFKRFFSFIDENNIEAACYINNHWDTQPMWKDRNWGDTRIESNQFVKQEWLKEIQKEKYLKSSEDLFDLLKK